MYQHIFIVSRLGDYGGQLTLISESHLCNVFSAVKTGFNRVTSRTVFLNQCVQM